MYIKWDLVLNQPEGLPSNFPSDEDDSWVPLVNPPPANSLAQTLVWELISGQCVGRWEGSEDPLDVPATLEMIRAKHLELEASPVMVFGVLLDADLLSEKRIRDCIATLEHIPLRPGSVEEIAGVRVRYWKDANNLWHALSGTVLQTLLDEMIKERSIRASALFDRVQELKATVGDHTINQINSLEYWGV